MDGAFFGELPMLGLANGELRNQHVYTVEAVTESTLTYLKLEDMEDMERDYPIFKSQVRQLASKRAERFGLEIKRVTITVSSSRRRMSVALDEADSLDPDMARAFGIGAKNLPTMYGAKSGANPVMDRFGQDKSPINQAPVGSGLAIPEADKDAMAALAARKRAAMAEHRLEEDDSDESEEYIAPPPPSATSSSAAPTTVSDK